MASFHEGFNAELRALELRNRQFVGSGVAAAHIIDCARLVERYKLKGVLTEAMERLAADSCDRAAAEGRVELPAM